MLRSSIVSHCGTECWGSNFCQKLVWIVEEKGCLQGSVHEVIHLGHKVAFEVGFRVYEVGVPMSLGFLLRVILGGSLSSSGGG